MVHIRFEGRSYDLPEAQLGLVFGMTDGDIKAKIARHFDVAEEKLQSHVVDRPCHGHEALVVDGPGLPVTGKVEEDEAQVGRERIEERAE